MARTDIALEIELAAELLDAAKQTMDPAEWDRRRQLIDSARAPRVPHLRRVALLDEACSEMSPPVVEAIIVARVVADSLRDAEKLIDRWLQAGEDDDRLISYTVTDRAALAQEGGPA